MKSLALHHIYHKKPEPNLLNTITIFSSILLPLAALPQVYKLYQIKDSSEIASITWILWTILTIPLLIYSIKHKAKPLIILYSLWLAVYALMLAGIILYR